PTSKRDWSSDVCSSDLRGARGPRGEPAVRRRDLEPADRGAVLFTPVELLEKLAALTPRPRVNLVLYHGILAPRARARARAVAHGAPSPGERPRTAADEPGPRPSPPLAH